MPTIDRRAQEREQRGGLEPGPAEALEELERGGGDDHGDQHGGAGATDEEREDRDRGEDGTGDDARGEVVARRRDARAWR